MITKTEQTRSWVTSDSISIFGNFGYLSVSYNLNSHACECAHHELDADVHAQVYRECAYAHESDLMQEEVPDY